MAWIKKKPEEMQKLADTVEQGSANLAKSIAPSTGGSTADGKFTYSGAPKYNNQYADQIGALTDELMNREKFSYDPNHDPLYEQYQTAYTREGKRAMQDTVGDVSARTGGLASSYATTAASQAYDNYMGQLADKIPELEQLAYSMYRDDQNDKRQDIQMLLALEQGDYGKYQDLLNQYNADRGFGYGIYSDDWNRNYQTGRDQIADSRYDAQWQYQLGRDQIADSRYEDELKYSREQDQLNRKYQTDTDNYNRAMAKWQLTGTLDAESAKVLGLPAGTRTSDYEYRMAQLAQAGKGSSGRSASGNTLTDLFQNMYNSGSPYSYLNSYYKDYGVAYKGLEGVWDDYENWASSRTYGGNGNAVSSSSSEWSAPQSKMNLSDHMTIDVKNNNSLNTVDRSLKRMYDRGDTQNEMSAFIAQCIEDGRISKASAQQLLVRYGIDL